MADETIVQQIFYLLPALIVGILAFYFFRMHTNNEEQRRRFLLQRENQKEALPIRLQAYERMTLFLERISPGNLLVRVKPYNNEKAEYSELLIKTIEQEFEHNLAQQIYISEECWNVIKASKNATINNIRKVAAKEESQNAQQFRQEVLTSLLEQQSPSDTGLAYIKNEVGKIFL